MELNINDDRAPRNWLHVGFYVTAVVFNLCLIAQLLTVGMAYFVDSTWWNVHIWLVRGYAGLALLLLGWMTIVPCSRKIRSLTISLPVLLGFQFGSIHLKTLLHLEVLHPLVGFSLLYVSSSLVHAVLKPEQSI
jgi:Family of unknown function (DUF6220)